MIVSDSGPLIAFSKIGRLDILERLFDTVWVPDAVYHEVGADGSHRPGAQAIASSVCIQRRTASNLSLMKRFPNNIHAGKARQSPSHSNWRSRCSLTSDEAEASQQSLESMSSEVYGSLLKLIIKKCSPTPVR